MTDQMIEVDGKEKVVREDTASRIRGTRWMKITLALFIAVTAIVAIAFFLGALGNGGIDTPANASAPQSR